MQEAEKRRAVELENRGKQEKVSMSACLLHLYEELSIIFLLFFATGTAASAPVATIPSIRLLNIKYLGTLVLLV